jgi:hypothetical protein
MKKSVLIYLVLFAALTASADDKSSALLSKMAATIGGWKSYRVEFSLKADDAAKPVAGDYTVSGRTYHMQAGGNELFGDGKLKYQVDHANREVTVDRVDPADRSIMADPTRIFEFSDASFSHAYAGQQTWRGRRCDSVKLTAKESGSPLSAITLMIDAGTGLPAGLSYKVEGVSQPVEIDVIRIAPLADTADAGLKFDKSRYKGYEIMDFR